MIRPECLLPEYRNAAKQLVLATGGFGIRGNSRGRAVYTGNLYTGKEARWNREDFDLPDNIEKYLDKIDALSKKTPFLLLSHPFAKRSLETICDLAKRTNLSICLDKYYRRLEMSKTYVHEDFKYPPRDKLSEGRYNHAGFPVLYLSDSPTTCFYELRKPKEGIAVAEMKITKSLRILDLIEIEDDWTNIINVAAWSSLMSSPKEGDGWYKPQYTFTRFIADCAISAGFDAIKYPSVKLGERYNIVLLDGINGWGNLNITHIIKMIPGNKGILQPC